MTLYQKLRNEMENHRGFWNYYGVNFEDVFQDEGVARDFIYNYFKGGSKLYALDTWANSMNEYLQMRNVHTVNVFFIGAYLHPPFGARSNIAYYNRSATGKLESAIEYNNGTIIKASRYSGETENNYFYYRLQEMGKLDHGIIGADEFFSRLVVNYVKEYRVMAAGDFFRESIYEFHNERGLHFCSEQLKLFSYIADCIASHNMYKADDNERCITKYIDYSLNCLLPDKFEPISYKDNPLLFILCVADTIEPSKRFTNYHNEDVLNLISIDYNKNTNLLYVEVDEELYNCDVGHKYVSDIAGLEEWCDIKTSVASKMRG